MNAERPFAKTRFERICIVGFGNHARTKLFPALVANHQAVVGIVSGQSGIKIPNDVAIYRRVEEAIGAVPPDTTFVIATPPALHFEQALAVIESGRDVIVEKPAFVTERQARDAFTACERRGTVLVEAFMHRHSGLYRRMMEWWRAENQRVSAIEADFLIPELPAGSFRQDGTVASSVLYDIGSYALSVIADLGVPLDTLCLTRIDCPGDGAREALQLAGEQAGLKIEIRVGVDPAYTNRLRFRMSDEESLTFSPFFYGRAGERAIEHQIGVETTRQVIADQNAFEEMFAVTRPVWLDTQQKRSMDTIEVTIALERLGRDLLAARKSCSASP